MVFKRKKKFTKKRAPRRARKRFGGKPTAYTISRDVGIPDKMLTKLCTTYRHSYTQGAFIDQVLCLNSLYDPLQAIAAPQPMWFDEYSRLYKFYKCYKTMVNFQFQNGPAAPPVRYCMYANTDASAPANMEEARQRKGARYLVLGANT